jgi:hypothetical protein
MQQVIMQAVCAGDVSVCIEAVDASNAHSDHRAGSGAWTMKMPGATGSKPSGR